MTQLSSSSWSACDLQSLRAGHAMLRLQPVLTHPTVPDQEHEGWWHAYSKSCRHENYRPHIGNGVRDYYTHYTAEYFPFVQICNHSVEVKVKWWESSVCLCIFYVFLIQEVGSIIGKVCTILCMIHDLWFLYSICDNVCSNVWSCVKCNISLSWNLFGLLLRQLLLLLL